MSVCDFHLSRIRGDQDVQLRDFGNRLQAARAKAAAEWRSQIEAFLPRQGDLCALPDGSWLLEIQFRLARPFTSKTEGEFHPWEEREVDKKKRATDWFEIQNPVVRDHLTGLPIVRPTTWKGHLSFAAAAIHADPDVCARLFGTIRGSDAGQTGRLHFFPTFFVEATARDVVTPLSRDTRTPARGPIDFEVLGPGCRGRFSLLYVPRPRGRSWNSQQIPDDLEVAARAVKAMLLEYGFSAKKTSGWGVVHDSLVSGKFAAKGMDWPAARGDAGEPVFVEPDEAFWKLMDETGRPKPELRKSSGHWLSNQEYKAVAAGLASLSEYKRFRAWYEAHGAEWVRKQAGLKAQHEDSLRRYEFGTVSELLDLAERLAKHLREVGCA